MSERRAHVVAVVSQHGHDAMSFSALESGMSHWFDSPPPEGTGACVAYVDTGGGWVAACGPLAEEGDQARAALRFVEAARRGGRRASFFAAESLEAVGMTRLLIGQQPIFRSGDWVRELSKHRSLREQLRRASAKGVRARQVEASELVEGAPLRREVDQLAETWLRSRRIEPMQFLATVELFHHPDEHRYFVAEQDGRIVGFVSAVPMGRRGWLVEDVLRARSAPNGTTETLVVAFMKSVAEGGVVTLGLTPLAGPVSRPLRLARWLARPLFDFGGLRAFRERMHPHEWQPVWLVYPAWQSSLMTLIDTLRAFARGSLVAFGVRSLLRHPSGLPWALALPLPAWTLALAWLAATRRASLLGFPPFELALWVAFDALMLLVLVRVAMQPRRSRLLVATSFAMGDALLSLGHLAWVGLGYSPLQLALRSAAALAPTAGALLLAWATTRAA